MREKIKFSLDGTKDFLSKPFPKHEKGHFESYVITWRRGRLAVHLSSCIKRSLSQICICTNGEGRRVSVNKTF